MKLKIVAAIVDTRQLTLYKEDGTTEVLKQGDPRIRPILDAAIPAIAKQGWAEIELIDVETSFAEFEKKSGGMVRFFKVARDKLAKLFGSDEPVPEGAVGKVPELAQTQAAVDEILANAVSVQDPRFNTKDLAKQGNIREEGGGTDQQRREEKTSHTVVAVVGNKVIPNVERIETQFARAAKMGSTAGVERFLDRIGSVINQRSHSVEDLLKFMERMDTQIADDGTIVIYKVLNKRDGIFYDCHTGNVPQKVGSYVCMDIALVDPNRRNECSNGLHVARRGYINGFSGNACVIAKLAPEDVVAVPDYDANKMRVMGYHILQELPPDLYALLRANKPITDTDVGQTILGNVLAGNHVARLEEVRITQQRGGGVIVTPIAQAVPVSPKQKAKPKPPKAIKQHKARAMENPEGEKRDKALDPREVVKKVQGLTRKDQAQKLLKAYLKNPTQKNWDKIAKYRRTVRLGWGALGIPEDLVNQNTKS